MVLAIRIIFPPKLFKRLLVSYSELFTDVKSSAGLNSTSLTCGSSDSPQMDRQQQWSMIVTLSTVTTGSRQAGQYLNASLLHPYISLCTSLHPQSEELSTTSYWIYDHITMNACYFVGICIVNADLLTRALKNTSYKKIKTNLITKPDHAWGSHHLHLYFNSVCSSHWHWTWFNIWTMLCGNAVVMCWFHKGNLKTANPNNLLTYSSRSLTLNRKSARMLFHWTFKAVMWTGTHNILEPD